jgi:hypothetical protein
MPLVSLSSEIFFTKAIFVDKVIPALDPTSHFLVFNALKRLLGRVHTFSLSFRKLIGTGIFSGRNPPSAGVPLPPSSKYSPMLSSSCPALDAGSAFRSYQKPCLITIPLSGHICNPEGWCKGTPMVSPRHRLPPSTSTKYPEGL